MMIVVPNFQFGGRRMLLVVGEDEWRVEFKHVCGLKDSLKLSKQLGLVTSSIFKVGDELDFSGPIKLQAT